MSVQLAILGLLSEKPRHGYELRQEVEHRLFASYINLSGGSLYYNLGQLERAGYVEKAWVEQKGRYPARQVYQLTGAGREHLQTEVRRLLFDTDSRDKLYDPLNAALAFGHFIPAEELREALACHLEWARQRLRWVREQQDHWTGQGATLAQTKIIVHGLFHFRSEIEWLEDFLRDLDAQEARGHDRPSVKPETPASVS